MQVTFSAWQNQWTLYLVSARHGMVGESTAASAVSGDSWAPAWEAPLIALVVVVLSLLGALLLLLLASSIEREGLLRSEMQARDLLEEEKQHTDALIVRQLNLISCFASSTGSGSQVSV